MTALNIKRELSEDTRAQGVVIGDVVFALHIKDGEYIITDKDDYSKIYEIISEELSQFMGI